MFNEIEKFPHFLLKSIQVFFDSKKRKKINQLIKENKVSEAESILYTLLKKTYEREFVFNKLIFLAKKEGRKRDEKKWLEARQKEFGFKKEYHLEFITYLKKWGYFAEAEEEINKLLKKQPDNIDLAISYADTATLKRDYPEARRRYKEILDNNPTHTNLKVKYFKSLMNDIDFEAAHHFFEESLSASPKLGHLFLKLDLLRLENKRQEAYDYAKLLIQKFPQAQNLQFTLAYCLVDLADEDDENREKFIEEAIRILNRTLKENPNQEKFLNGLIKFNLLIGQEKEAAQHVASLATKKSLTYLRASIWQKHYMGQENEAKKTWEELKKYHYVPHIAQVGPDILQRKDGNPLSIAKNAILIFTVVRNEIGRIPWFLEYYRNLGVDRFFFVDNNSTDGTFEYLLEQDDVYLFHTTQPYATSYSGVRWLNQLMRDYGQTAWCMYIDVDEALIFPGIENKSLKDLTSFMDKEGSEAMAAFMLDMFSPEPGRTENVDFVKEYPYFLNNYRKEKILMCPYEKVKGGIRHHAFQVYENLTKTPIIRGGKGIQLLGSSHFVSPAKLSTMQSVLLHFKLAGDFKEIFKADLANNTRIPGCKIRHQKYLQAMEAGHPFDNLDPQQVIQFESSTQLLDLGLIQTNKEFFNYE